MHPAFAAEQAGFGSVEVRPEPKRRIDERRHVSLRCRNFLAAFRVVAESDLVLTMTARYAKLLTAASGVRVLPMPLRMPTLDLFLYWHDRLDGDPANRWLRAELVAALGKVAGLGKTVHP